MVFHLVLHHIAAASVNLLGDIVFQFWTGKCLLLSLGIDQIRRLHLYERVELHTAGDMLFQSFQLADFPIAYIPMILGIGDGIVLDFHRCHVADKLLAFKLVQRESISTLAGIVIMLYVGDNTLSHLQLYVLCRGILLLVLVHRLKILPDDGAVRNDIGTEVIRKHGYEHTGEHVGSQKSLEGYTRGQHGNDL